MRGRRNTPAPIGEALRWLRTTHEPPLTQEELAALTGVPKGSVGSIESGVSKNPRPHVINPLLSYFGFRTARDAIEAHMLGQSDDSINGADDAGTSTALHTREELEELAERVRRLEAVARIVTVEGIPENPAPEMAAFLYPDREPVRVGRVYGRIPASPPGSSEVDEKPLYSYPIPAELRDEPALFGVVVHGNSLARVPAFGGIRDGDIVWVRPGRRGVQLGDVVTARVRTKGNGWEDVLKLFKRAQGFPEGLWSQDEHGKDVLVVDQYEITGKVLAAEEPRRVRTARTA